MYTVAKKSFAFVSILIFAFSPLATAPKVTRASFLSENAGNLAVTALGCSGVLDKATSALSTLTSSVIGQEVPTTDNGTHIKENCLDAIAYTASKIVLAKITESTLNWINSGFDGSPTFVQEPGSFFESIANERISTFTAQIGFDPNRYPFGRLTAQNIINSIQNQLDYNASVSSGNLLNYDNNPNIPYKQRFDNYTQDFFYGGGWDGYLAVTQITEANPFDSYIKSVNQVGPTINAAQQQKNPITQITQELQQSGGFLALKKCVDPSWYTSERSDPTFTRAEATAQSKNDPNDADTQAAREWLVDHTCLRYETKTPGTAIAQQLNISTSSVNSQLINADELNESISAVFDALIKQLFKEGVASLSGEDTTNPGVNVLGGYGNNTGTSTIGTGTGGNGSNSSSQWFNQVQNFDLKEAIAPAGVLDDPGCHLAADTHGNILNGDDLSDKTICNQGLAVLQKAYADALEAENIKLQETVRWINYADYCVPGPRPDWYQTAVTNVGALQERFSDISQKTDDTKRASDSYLELKYFTGFAANYSDTVNLENPLHSYDAIWQTLSEKVGGPGYKQYIEDRYNPYTNPQMPLSTILINQEYSKKSHYQSVIDLNQTAIVEARSMTIRLANMYNNIRAAETQYQVGTPTEDTVNWDKFMKNQLKIFSKIAGQVRQIDDITSVTSDISLAEDEIKFLADPLSGLIKTCVTETANISATSPVFPSLLLTRRAYKETKASAPDFTSRGWTGDPLSGYTNNQTFLPGISISGTLQVAGYIYVGHYVNECTGIPFSGSATYAGCGDGDTVLSSTGDRFEEHINAY